MTAKYPKVEVTISMRDANDSIDSALQRSSQELKRLARFYQQRGLSREAQEIGSTAARIENRLESEREVENKATNQGN